MSMLRNPMGALTRYEDWTANPCAVGGQHFLEGLGGPASGRRSEGPVSTPHGRGVRSLRCFFTPCSALRRRLEEVEARIAEVDQIYSNDWTTPSYRQEEYIRIRGELNNERDALRGRIAECCE
jgi:hypothetical protein